MSGLVPHPFEKDPSRIVRSISDLFAGRSNAVGQFTCTQNQATTDVTAINCGEDSKVFIMARHTNAAAEVGAGTIYISAITNGQFTVTHANSATASRTFDFVCLG